MWSMKASSFLDKTIIVAEDIDLLIWTSFGLEMGLVQAIANVEVFAMTSTVAVGSSVEKSEATTAVASLVNVLRKRIVLKNNTLGWEGGKIRTGHVRS